MYYCKFITNLYAKMSCSFCKSKLHNINHCTNPMIDELYLKIKNIYIDMVNSYPIDSMNSMNNFKTRVDNRFYLNELRGVGVKYLHCYANATKKTLLNKLWEHFNSQNQTNILEHSSEHSIEVNTIPLVLDPIPEFAQDLELNHDLVHTPNNNVTWHIDTTPSPTIPQRSRPILRPRSQNYLSRAQNYLSRFRNYLFRNLESEFNAVASQTSKFNISSVLEIDEDVKIDDIKIDTECAICYENINNVNFVELNCSHKFCGYCIQNTLKRHNNVKCGPTCALCRTLITKCNVKNVETYKLISEHCNI